MTDLSTCDCVRVALLADTHGHLDRRIVELVSGCDIAVHAGDVGNAAVLAALKPRREIVVAVRGNIDVPAKWPQADQAALSALARVAILALPGGRLAVSHGDRHNPARRRHQLLRREFAAVRAVVYGHSHRLVCDLDARPWILNPGAAGRARTYGGPSCLILTAREDEWVVAARRFARE